MFAPEPAPIRSSLDRLMRDLGGPDVSTVGRLMGEWSTIVGADLAKVCRPVTLRASTLVVVTSDPALVDHLRWLSADLVSSLCSRLGEGVVTEVEVRVRRHA